MGQTCRYQIAVGLAAVPNPSAAPDGYSPLLSQMNASTDPYGSYQSDFLRVALSGRRELQM
jgi:hypothetical protein